MRKLLPFCSALLLSLVAVSVSRADTCNGVATNLVSNCGFESGSLSSWTGTATTAGATSAGVDNGDPFTTVKTPYQGTYEAYLGSLGSTFALSQTLATTAGSLYSIEFALLNDTSPTIGYLNSFEADFGSSQLFSESSVLAGDYTLHSFSAIATGPSTQLSFLSRNDGGYFELDSVSVNQVVTPEPSSFVLLGTGLLGAAETLRRRRSAARA